MSEEKRLAEWLMDPTHPSGLSTEVEEAIFILRPDLAPPANIDIDDVWNASQAATGDETEDIGLVRDIFAQQQAPSPRVSINDIFAEISAGPLAAPEGSKAPTPIDNVVPLRPWIKKPMFLSGLAAALALIILLPTRLKAPSIPHSQVDAADFEPAPPQNRNDEPSKKVQINETIVFEKEERVREEIAKSSESLLQGKPSSKSAPTEVALPAPPRSSPVVTISPNEELAPPPQAELAVEAANYEQPSIQASDESEASFSSDPLGNEANTVEASDGSGQPVSGQSSGWQSSNGRSVDMEMDEMVAEVDAFAGAEAGGVDSVGVLEMSAQVSCQMPPYPPPVSNDVAEALSSSGEDKLAKVQTLLGSATGDEMIYLSVEIFHLQSPSEAVLLLESALRVVGTSAPFRCSGYRYLGDHFYNQGDLVKAEGYYRQASQP